MRISISNIAWDIEEDDLVAELLSKYRVDAIDIAPGKYFPYPSEVSDCEIATLRNYWTRKGFEITGMQSLLFGTSGLNIFASRKIQDRILLHLEGICRIACKLGVTRLVFGSPKNRDRSGLSDVQAIKQAVMFFRRLGDIAQFNEVRICLEPNPTCYGANFMTNSQETLEVVMAVGHSAVKMQLDIGSIVINQESIEEVLISSQRFIGHIHISEPNLSVIGSHGLNHEKFAQAIKKSCIPSIVTIEMLATKDEPHLTSVERALKLVTQIYRDSL